MYKIIIKEARFLCNVGVTKQEQDKKQEIVVDIKMSIDGNDFLDDDLENTVNYSKVHELVKNIAESKEYRLIETMAENIANGILKKFPIENVTVSVQKPNAMSNKNVRYVAVEIKRDKSSYKNG